MAGRTTRIALAAAVGVAATAGIALAAGSAPEQETSAAAARTDRWTALRPAALRRTEVAAARIGTHIYVVGGFVPSRATTAAAERYDIRTNRWRRIPDMPVAVNHPAAAAYGGDLYVLGGYTANGGLSGETAAFQRYDPERNSWTRLRPMPTKRAALAVGVIGDRLYAAGGAAAGGAVTFGTLEAYDFGTRRWTRGPSLRFAREHVAGAVAGGAFYVIAGRTPNVPTVERYTPGARRWVRLPDLRKERSGIAAATVGGRVVVFGGEESAGTIAPVETYDPASRRWRALPRMLTPRHGLGGVAYGSRVFAVQGGPQPGFAFSNAIEVLDVRPR